MLLSCFPEKYATSFARTRGAGFTLLEVVVALAILGMALGTLLEIFSGGITGADLTSRYAQAATLAESRLAAVGSEIPLQEGETTGDLGDAYRWAISIKPFQEAPKAEQPGNMHALMRVQLFEVVARVTWSDSGKQREIVLATLQLGAKS
jgi:general secretion pathway protein I